MGVAIYRQINNCRHLLNEILTVIVIDCYFVNSATVVFGLACQVEKDILNSTTADIRMGGH